jgi:hypothetical protein
MTAREYYHAVLQLLTTARVVVSHRVEFDEQDAYIAYLKGALNLIDGSTLFFAQYVQIEHMGSGQINRKKYRYHWQALDGNTRYRWDNARHHASLPSFPHHVHVGAAEEVRENGPVDLWLVLGQIEKEL